MRAEINAIVLHRNHSWNTHHAVPLTVYCLRHSHPCNNNTIAIFISRTLRGIEIQPIVQKLNVICKLHRSGRFIECGEQTDRCGIIRFSIVQKSHGGKHRDALAICLKIVRTLPHPAEVVLFHVAEILPVLQIPALINQQSALLGNRASQYHIPCICSTPYLRVTGVRLAADLIFCNGGNDRLFVMNIIKSHAVCGRDHHLCREKLIVLAVVNVLRILLQIVDTGIIQVHRSVLLHSTAGKTAAAVVGLGRIQGDSLFLPVHQILADSMSPVHSAPLRCVGKALVKQMILPLVPDKSVRIIDPAIRGFEMNFLHSILPIRKGSLRFAYQKSAFWTEQRQNQWYLQAC